MLKSSLYPYLLCGAMLGGIGVACAPAGGSDTSAAMTISTTSAEARTSLEAAFSDWFNVFGTRAVENAGKAVAADSTLGVARAVLAFLDPAMADSAREANFNRAVADAASSSHGEMVVAAALRATDDGRTDEARALYQLAANMMPGDANVAYLGVMLAPPDSQIVVLEDMTLRFPDFPAAYNILAYRKVAGGDTAGALAAVERYVELMPTHPNAQDSYAELLQFSGRYPEALEHYNKAIELDASYIAGYTGVAEANLLSGDHAAARAAYEQASEHAPNPPGRLSWRAAAATTFLAEGKTAEALAGLGAIAREAEAENIPGLAAAIHRNMALIEAAVGNPAMAGGHLTKAASLTATPPPVHNRVAAIVMAEAGQAANADESAAAFAAQAAAGSEIMRENSHEVAAVVAASKKDFETARAELAMAGDAALGNALVAAALAEDGKSEEASVLRDKVMRGRGATFFDIVARAAAARM